MTLTCNLYLDGELDGIVKSTKESKKELPAPKV